MLIGMNGLAVDQCLGQHVSGGRLELGWDSTLDRLDFGFEIEPEVAAPALNYSRWCLRGPPSTTFGGPRDRIAPYQIVRQRSALNPRPRGTEAVRKEAQGARHRAPAAGHRRLGYSRLMAIDRAFVDDKVERHDPGEQVGPAAPDLLGGVGKLLRQRQLQRAVNRGNAQCGIFDCLDQHAPALGPLCQPVLEQMARQAVDLAQVAVLVHRFGKQVVGRQVVAAADQHPMEVALFPGHPVQRVDVGADRHHGDQLVVGVHQELAPGALHRQRLDFPAIAREPAVFDQARGR